MTTAAPMTASPMTASIIGPCLEWQTAEDRTMLDQTTDFAPVPDYLPLIAAGNIAPSVKKSALRRSVLVVDDEALVRWTVTEVLTAAGYEVLEAHDGTSALRTGIEPT